MSLPPVTVGEDHCCPARHLLGQNASCGLGLGDGRGGGSSRLRPNSRMFASEAQLPILHSARSCGAGKSMLPNKLRDATEWKPPRPPSHTSLGRREMFLRGRAPAAAGVVWRHRSASRLAGTWKSSRWIGSSIPYKTQPSQPQFSAIFIRWDFAPRIAPSVFTPQLPAGVQKIEFAPAVAGASRQ